MSLSVKDAAGSGPIEYRAIAGFPGYRVGDDGTVWSQWSRNGRGLKPSGEWHQLKPSTSNRYLHVTLMPGRVCRFVHRLVLEAFVGPRPEGYDGCHFPRRDVTDNRLSNLRWDTKKANQADRIAHGTQMVGDTCPASKVTEQDVLQIRALHAAGELQTELGKRYGVTKHAVHLIVKRRNWRHVA